MKPGEQPVGLGSGNAATQARRPKGRCLWCAEIVYSNQAFVRVWGDVVHERCGPYQPRFGAAGSEARSLD